MVLRIRETIENCCYGAIGLAVSIWLWWPWRYLTQGEVAPSQAANLAIVIFMVAGVVNLAFTIAVIRKQARIRNGFNLVAGAISIMAFLFMLLVGV